MNKEETELMKEAFRLITGLAMSNAWQDCDEEANEWLVRFAQMFFHSGLEAGKKEK